MSSLRLEESYRIRPEGHETGDTRLDIQTRGECVPTVYFYDEGYGRYVNKLRIFRKVLVEEVLIKSLIVDHPLRHLCARPILRLVKYDYNKLGFLIEGLQPWY